LNECLGIAVLGSNPMFSFQRCYIYQFAWIAEFLRYLWCYVCFFACLYGHIVTPKLAISGFPPFFWQDKWMIILWCTDSSLLSDSLFPFVYSAYIMPKSGKKNRSNDRIGQDSPNQDNPSNRIILQRKAEQVRLSRPILLTMQGILSF